MARKLVKNTRLPVMEIKTVSRAVFPVTCVKFPIFSEGKGRLYTGYIPSHSTQPRWRMGPVNPVAIFVEGHSYSQGVVDAARSQMS